MSESTRACPECGEAIPRKAGEFPWQYNRRRYCSRVCGSKASNARRAEDARTIIEQRSRADASGCRLWTANVNHSGYGVVTRRMKVTIAHRLAYEAYIGPIPPGMCVCHRCDVRACVNPDHLFLGTNADNTRDRNAKGRQARGERQGRAKLTADDVRAIRRSPARHVDLARAYGVGPTAIHNIRARLSWRHVD